MVISYFFFLKLIWFFLFFYIVANWKNILCIQWRLFKATGVWCLLSEERSRPEQKLIHSYFQETKGLRDSNDQEPSHLVRVVYERSKKLAVYRETNGNTSFFLEWSYLTCSMPWTCSYTVCMLKNPSISFSGFHFSFSCIVRSLRNPTCVKANYERKLRIGFE